MADEQVIDLTPEQQLQAEQLSGAGIDLSPEQETQARQLSGQLDPLLDFTPDQLSALEISDPENFNIRREFLNRPDLRGKNDVIMRAALANQKVRARYDQPAAFKEVTENLPDLLKPAAPVVEKLIAEQIPVVLRPAVRLAGAGKQLLDTAKTVTPGRATKAVLHFAGGLAKYAFNSIVGAASPFVPEEAKQDYRRRAAENLAASEQQISGLASGVKATALKAAQIAGIAKPFSEYDPTEARELFFADLDKTAAQEEMARGKGAITRQIGGEVIAELEAVGKPVRPEEVASLSDPFTFYAYTKLFGAAGGLVPAEAKAAASNASRWVGEVGRDITGTALEGIGESARIFSKGTTALSKLPAQLIPPSVLPPIVLPLIKRAAKILPDVSEGVKSVGKQIRTGEFVSPSARLIADVAETAPTAIADIAGGAAFDIVTTAAMAEFPEEEIGGGVGIGTVFGLIGAGRHVTRRVISGQEIAPRVWGGKNQIPTSGPFKGSEFDTLHNTAYQTATPAIKQRVNAVREFLRKGAPGVDLFYVPDKAAFETGLINQGVPAADARLWADQSGLFVRDLNGKKVAFAVDIDAAPHESFHPFQDVLGETANNILNQKVKSAYTDSEFENEARRYASRLGWDGNGDWRDFTLDATGEGYHATINKLAQEAANIIKLSEGKEATPAEAKEQGTRMFAEAMAEATAANPDTDPNILRRSVWRGILTEAEQKNLADNYAANELAAETWDAVFKHTGPGMKDPKGLIPKFARMAGNIVAAMGGEPLAGRESQVGELPLKRAAVDAVREAVRGKIETPPLISGEAAIPRTAPTKPSPLPSGAPAPITAEDRATAAENTLKIAADASDAPVAGGTRSEKELLGEIAAAQAGGDAVKINYLSAPDEPAAAITSRRDVRRQLIEMFRSMPAAARSLWEKNFFPDQVRRTSKGKIQVGGWAPEVFAANAHKTAQTLSKLDPALSPYPINPITKSFTEQGWKDLYADTQKFVGNQTAGQTGSGETLVVPQSMIEAGFFKPPQSAGAGGLDQRKADFISAMFGFKLPDTPRIQKGKTPLNIAGQIISEATLPGRTEIPVRPRGEYAEPFTGREVLEVNKWRREFEQAAQGKVDLPSVIEAFQWLNLENIKEVQHTPEQPQFRANTLTLQAGFSPAKPGEKEFENWHKSSVVKKKIYHGSTGDFKEIDPGFDNLMAPYAAGILFTSDPQVARKFGHVLYEGFIQIRNPLDIDKSFSADEINGIINTWEKLPEGGQEAADELRQALSSGFDDVVGEDIMRAARNFREGDPTSVHRALESLGFDGIKHIATDKKGGRLGGGRETITYGVFRPEQFRTLKQTIKKETFQPEAGYRLPRAGFSPKMEGTGYESHRDLIDDVNSGKFGEIFGFGYRSDARKNWLRTVADIADAADPLEALQLVAEEKASVKRKLPAKEIREMLLDDIAKIGQVKDQIREARGFTTEDLELARAKQTGNESQALVKFAPKPKWEDIEDAVERMKEDFESQDWMPENEYGELIRPSSKEYETAKEWVSHGLPTDDLISPAKEIADEIYSRTGEAGPIKYSPMPANDMAIRAPAMKDETTGRIYEGFIHAVAQQDAESRGAKGPFTRGFVTNRKLPNNKIEFLNVDEAFDRAEKIGQLPEGQLEMPGGGLESTRFEEVRRFSPPKKDKGYEAGEYWLGGGKLNYARQGHMDWAIDNLYKEGEGAIPQRGELGGLEDAYKLAEDNGYLRTVISDNRIDVGSSQRYPAWRDVPKELRDAIEDVQFSRDLSVYFAGRLVSEAPGVPVKFSPAAERKEIELTGPDGKKYRAMFDGYQDFSASGLGHIAQITPLEDLPGSKVKGSTTYGSSLEKAGYKLPADLLAPEGPGEAQFSPPKEERKTKSGPRKLKNAAEEDAFDLIHYSSTPGLKTVDPKHFGKGKATPVDLRGGPKSYFFVKGSDFGQDAAIFENAGLHTHAATVKGSDLYDLRAGKPDDLGWRKTVNREEADDLIKDAGYKGIILDTADGRQVVSMFKPVKVIEDKGAAFSPKKDDPVKTAAVKDETGNIFEGAIHSLAQVKAEDAGSEGPFTHGFTTESGDFLTNDAALSRALNTKQVRPGQLSKYERNFGELEAKNFEKRKAFSPKTDAGRKLEEEEGFRFRLTPNETGTIFRVSVGKGGKEIGSISATLDGEKAEIHMVHVDTEYRQQGIGEALYRELASELQQRGASSVGGYTAGPSLGIRERVFGSVERPEEGTTKVSSPIRPETKFAPKTDAGRKLEEEGFRFRVRKIRDIIDIELVPKGKQNWIGSMFAEINPEAGTAKVGSVKVEPSFQNKGIGETLYRELASHLQELGIETLTGDVISPAPLKIREKLFGGSEILGEKSTAMGGYAKQVRSKVDPEAKFSPKREEFEDPETIREALSSPGWAIITGTQEKIAGKKVSWDDPRNIAANARLRAELKAKGYETLPVEGKYKSESQGESFAVMGITPAEAQALGKKYGQESILTNQGLIYGDGSRTPSVPEKTLIGPEAEKQEFYSITPEGTAFSIGLDFDKPYKPVGEQQELFGKTESNAQDFSRRMRARIADKKERYPESAPLGYEKNADGSFRINSKTGKPVPEKQDHNFLESGLAKESGKGLRGGEAREAAYVKAAGDDMAAEYQKAVKDPEVAAGAKWYSTLRTRLRKLFGDQSQLVCEVLAATSARTPVETNYKFSLDAVNKFNAGDYDAQITKYQEGLDNWDAGNIADYVAATGRDNPKRATFLDWWINTHDLKPRQSNGKLFAANSKAVLRALHGSWEGGKKTRQFSQNMSGADFGATVDVWAARTLHRISNENRVARWRILAEHENAVQDADFDVAQKVFKHAADKAGIKPDAMQGVLWFREKDIWEKRGWTNKTGAEKSDFSSLIAETERAPSGQYKIKSPQGELFDVQPRPTKPK